MFNSLKIVLLIFLTLGIIPPILGWSIDFSDPTDISFVNRNYILVNVTSSASNTTNITINLYDSNWFLNTTNSTSDEQNWLFVNFTDLSEGTYYFNATATDNESWTENKTGNVTIDLTSPIIQYSDPTDNVTIVNRPYIIINITIGDTNPENMTIYIYNSSLEEIYNVTNTTSENYTSYYLNYSVLDDGLYYFNAIVYDKAQHFNFSELRNITIDTTAPDITIISPNSTTYTNGTILINITTTALDIDMIWFFNGTGNETYNISTPVYRTYAEGTNYTIYAYANDSLGNLNVTNVTFSVALNVEPNVTMTSPENDSNVSQRYVLLNVTVYDSDLDNLTVWFIGDDSNINVTYDQTNGTGVIYNWTSLSDGLHNWTAIANDGTANSTYEYYYFMIDTTGPTITIHTPNSSGTTVNVSNLTFNVTAQDDRLKNITLRMYNSSWGLINSTNQTTNSTQSEIYVVLSNKTDGVYYYNVTAYDNLGNINISNGNITINTSTSPVDEGGDDDEPSHRGSNSGGDYVYIQNNTTSNDTDSVVNDTDKIIVTEYIPRQFNGSKVIEINKQGIPLIYISLYIASPDNKSNTLDIISQSNNPYGKNISTKIYRYIRFNSTLDTLNIKDVIVKFKLSKSWMLQNNLTANDVTVYYYDKDWSRLNTSKYSEDTGYIYYSTEVAELKSLAIGGPIVYMPVPIKKNETENAVNTVSNITEETAEIKDEIEVKKENQGFFKNAGKALGNFFEGASNNISSYVSELAATKNKQSLIILSISFILTLILGIVASVLIYKNFKVEKKHEKIRYKIPAGSVPYEEEPPTKETIVSTASIEAKKPEPPPLPNAEMYLKKINQLLAQCEYTLDNGKLEEAKKYHSEARSIYFKSNLEYAQKVKVYNKIIELQVKIGKNK